MRTLLTLIWLSLFSLALPAHAAILSLFGPQEVEVNDTFAVHLQMMSEISHERIGSFDIDIHYDASLLQWTGYSLGSELADPVWGQLDLSRGLLSPGVVNVAEVATLLDLSGQPEEFILATLDFKAIAPGDARVDFWIQSVSTEDGWYINEWGVAPLDPIKITSGTGPVDPTDPVDPPHPVSLPGTLTLLGLGLFLLWAARRAPRQLMAVLLAITLLPPPGYAIERVTYYHNDPLGSPIAATAEDGTLLWRERYQPYGSRELQGASAHERLGFTGKAEEAFLGLQDFGARWYDPASGRFISPDPVGFVESNLQSFNRYAYANNNPYRYVDPDGRAPWLVAIPLAFVLWGGEQMLPQPEVPFNSGQVTPVSFPDFTVLKGAATVGLVGVWSINPLKRGVEIEDVLAATDYKDWFRVGSLHNGYFPLIDFQEGLDVVSLKTVNTLGKSWMADMKDHILDLRRGITVDGVPANKILDIRVQPGGSDAAKPLIDYGSIHGITVRISEYP